MLMVVVAMMTALRIRQVLWLNMDEYGHHDLLDCDAIAAMGVAVIVVALGLLLGVADEDDGEEDEDDVDDMAATEC